MIRRDREGHYILIKGKIHQEDTVVLNVYAPNTRAPTFIERTMLQLKSHVDLDAVVWVISEHHSHQYTCHPDER